MKPFRVDGPVTLYHGDCLKALPAIADESVDAVVTDPPYALEFMGRGWDKFTPLEFEEWVSQWAAECLRVLKPGGHMLAFGGSRTWHRLAAGIEDAGFEIRDSIAWLYGSGFPKSLDVSKAIDAVAPRIGMPEGFAAHYAERRRAKGLSHTEVCRLGGFHGAVNHGGASANWEKGSNVPTPEQWATLADILEIPHDMWAPLIDRVEAEREATGTHRAGVTVGAAGLTTGGTGKDRRDNAATDAAKVWEGWGTALKPAFEPVVVARKPLTGTVAANVLAYGTGALNIDASRIGRSEGDRTEYGRDRHLPHANTTASLGKFNEVTPYTPDEGGRWPTNVVLDESQAEALDTQSGPLHTQDPRTRYRSSDPSWSPSGTARGTHKERKQTTGGASEAGTGASRFFPTFRYEAKAPTSERPKAGEIQHPTVKPLDLMRWLVRLVTPPGGTILEPFAGSGTTVEAAVLEGFQCIAIEREADYLPLIEQRLSKPMQQSLFDDLEGIA